MIVDFTSGLNLYPDLRVVKDSIDEYERSMARMYDVLTKMSTKLNASTATAATATYSSQCIVRGMHGVENNSNIARVHLVIDIKPTAEMLRRIYGI